MTTIGTLTLEPPRKKSRAPPKRVNLPCTCISGSTPDRLKIPTSDSVPCPVGLQEPSGNLWPLSNLLIRRINYVIFVCNVVSLLFMKYKARTIWCLLFIARQKRLYLFSKAHTCSVRYSTVQYGLVRFPCRFRTTFCASFRWCWPPDSRDVTPGDVVDIFCLLGRVLVVVFAAFFISPDDRYSQRRKSQWLSVPHMQHCQFFHKSKIIKGKFTHLGGSSVKVQADAKESRLPTSSLYIFIFIHHIIWQHKQQWNKNTTNEKKTRCSAIAERPRCRMRYSFRRK